MRAPDLPREGDTIAAVSTPYGVGGIGIVRMSGPVAEKIALQLFKPKRQCEQFTSHRFYYGHIYSPQDGRLVDEVLLVLMRPPHSYTREEMVEIHCHGGPLPVRKILDLAIAQGARLADPGEFTRRAFLNGRIDLVQAEAVVDIIEAKSETALRFAEKQLDGNLSQQILDIKNVMRDLLVLIEAWLDFPEEDMPEPEFEGIRERLEENISRIQSLISTYQDGHLYRDGVNLVIGGRPNVGKSTLLNALVGRERAIVSPEPGTTRDYLEESLLIRGIPIRLIDTAGLREYAEEVEAQGVALARRQIDAADMILYVVDASQADDESAASIGATLEDRPGLIVLNKIDLIAPDVLSGWRQGFTNRPVVPVSALCGQGIDQLREAVFGQLISEEIDLDSRAVVTNLRHRLVLEKSQEAMKRALEQLRFSPLMGDLLAADLRLATGALGEIIGETTPDEILNIIFDSFCIGK